MSGGLAWTTKPHPIRTLTRTMKTMYPRKKKIKRSLTTTSGIGLTHIGRSTAVAVSAIDFNYVIS